MSRPAFIAGDWGTSRLRLYLCDETGHVMARGEGEGASVPDCAGRFTAAIAAWDRAHGKLPAVLGGMVGSTIGWREVPYLACPARPEAIAEAVASNDASASKLKRYEELFEASWAKDELYGVRNWRQAFEGGVVGGMLDVPFQMITGGRGLVARRKGHADHTTTRPVSMSRFTGS